MYVVQLHENETSLKKHYSTGLCQQNVPKQCLFFNNTYGKYLNVFNGDLMMKMLTSLCIIFPSPSSNSSSFKMIFLGPNVLSYKNNLMKLINFTL